MHDIHVEHPRFEKGWGLRGKILGLFAQGDDTEYPKDGRGGTKTTLYRSRGSISWGKKDRRLLTKEEKRIARRKEYLSLKGTIPYASESFKEKGHVAEKETLFGKGLS